MQFYWQMIHPFYRLRNVQWLCALLLLFGVGCVCQPVATPIPPFENHVPFSESGPLEAPSRWWQVFQDSGLNQQVDLALDNNFSLEAALQRVRAARAFARRESSDLLPDINGVLGVRGDLGPGPNTNSYTIGLDTSYQVDLWGEIESRSIAEWLRSDASCADYHAIALTLSADIARTWFSLIEANAQVELLKEQIKTNRTGLELQESRFELGLIRLADVLRQKQLLESTLEQAVIADLRVEVLEHQLAILLGEMPQSAKYETGSQLPDLPSLPSTGLPSELVRRRPDVLREFLSLQAADQDLASAVSAQYPRLNLSGSVTNFANNPDSFFRDWFVSLAGQLIAPLFDGGQRRAQVDIAAANKLQLFNNFIQTILGAFREVEDSLAQEKYQLLRIERLEKQVELAGQASDQLRELYLTSDAEYLDVLSAITGQQSLQRQLLSAQLELRLIRVSLYLALAGSIEPADESTQFFQDELQQETQETEQLNPVELEPQNQPIELDIRRRIQINQ